ncbi:hypothetical protein PsYK624_053570 [Phanerochaete sordida]|uniref:Uncharacterized protein n=1 Tax=Phanerochaete sordida TaxID=48140 RepID=A0A9P3LBJ3_9APHY|nr:hypothetical protein PsYK624_053570 [Phanerochaete sordida]
MMADVFDTTIPLPLRLSTQLFELRLSDDDIFAGDVEDKTAAHVGHVLYDATTKALSVSTERVAEKELKWNDLSNTVTWTCAGASLCEGRLCFTDDLREAIGTVTRRNGESVVVTASPMPTYPREAPPTYRTPPIPGFHPAGLTTASPYMMLSAIGGEAASEKDTTTTQKVYMTEFKTERRLKTEDGQAGNSGWVRWDSLEWGMETQSPGTPVVCFVDDVDVSAYTTLAHSDPGTTTLVKTEGDAGSTTADYTFSITLPSEVEVEKQTFTGTLVHGGDTYEWRGAWRRDRELERAAAAAAVSGGPGGGTVTQLMAVTSLKSTTKEVEVEVEGKDGKPRFERRIVTEDMAQEEADRIFARIIMRSAPADVMQMLAPDMAKLDREEAKIAALGPDYLARAALVNVFSFLKNTDGVSQAQKDRINEDKCKAFVRACAQTSPVKEGDHDYVKMWGWEDKERNTIQSQYRSVAQACYRLGYRRAVKEFEAFLVDAKEWYGIFARHLTGELHTRELTGRVKVGDTKVAHDVYDWHNKLQVLQDEAGEIKEDDPKIVDVVAHLHGIASISVFDGIPWNSEHGSNIIKFFEDLDGIKNNAKLSFIAKTKDYIELQRLLKEREDHDSLTVAELAKQVVEGLNDHARQLTRTPSLAELSSAVTRNELRGFWPKTLARSRTVARWIARVAVVFAGIYFLQQTLGNGAETFSLAEQVSIVASLADAGIQAVRLLAVPIRWVAQTEFAAKVAAKVAAVAVKMVRGLGNALGKLVPARAVAWMAAVRAWIKRVFGKGIPGVGTAAKAVKGFFTRNWANIAKGIGLVFGFFVSVAALAASAFEFAAALREGRPVEALFAGTQLVVAALGVLAFAVQIVASLAGATQIAAIAGTLGICLAAIGIVVAAIAFVVSLSQPREDPIKRILDTHGGTYGLLK